jgi:hypothetical protein
VRRGEINAAVRDRRYKNRRALGALSRSGDFQSPKFLAAKPHLLVGDLEITAP